MRKVSVEGIPLNLNMAHVPGAGADRPLPVWAQGLGEPRVWLPVAWGPWAPPQTLSLSPSSCLSQARAQRSGAGPPWAHS